MFQACALECVRGGGPRTARRGIRARARRRRTPRGGTGGGTGHDGHRDERAPSGHPAGARDHRARGRGRPGTGPAGAARRHHRRLAAAPAGGHRRRPGPRGGTRGGPAGGGPGGGAGRAHRTRAGRRRGGARGRGVVAADRRVAGRPGAGCLDNIIERESGGSVHAINPNSGAYGIPQALPAAKMASTGPDWQTNPVTQVRWMVQYVDTEYGGACGAWTHWQADGTY